MSDEPMITHSFAQNERLKCKDEMPLTKVQKSNANPKSDGSLPNSELDWAVLFHEPEPVQKFSEFPLVPHLNWSYDEVRST
jgi:hypothetical protein